MSQFHRFGLAHGASRLVLAGLTSALLAGCSSDVSRFADFGTSTPFQSSARVDQGQGSSYGGSQQMASAAPVSAVQSAPLSAPVQSAPLSAPMSAPVRAAVTAPPMGQPRVISGAPVRAAAEPVRATAAPNLAAVKSVIAQQPPAAAPAKPATTTVAKAEPAKPAAVAQAPAAKPMQVAVREQPNTKSDAAPTAPTAPTVASEDGSPEFRWPARGRIITGFKTGKSEGISIAVPEGTAVKAAEGGTVAYAGSELKNYGNLVLIRHPNGFVSAYAHNGELLVKRGDTVKRGQVVAKSGQSGDVTSPQLQFQLRKGSTPVDPTQYLAGL